MRHNSGQLYCVAVLIVNDRMDIFSDLINLRKSDAQERVRLLYLLERHKFARLSGMGHRGIISGVAI